MHRFYCEHADFNQPIVRISDLDEVHHIKDVLRLKKGDMVQVFNGASQEAEAVIESLQENAVLARVRKVRQNAARTCRIILACAPPKKGKFEFIIEKVTELGVSEIIPLKTKRTEVIFKEERMAGKLGRFEKVALNAAKQSQRTDIPKIHPMMSMGDVLKSLDPQGTHLIASLNGHPGHIREVLLKKMSLPNDSSTLSFPNASVPSYRVFPKVIGDPVSAVTILIGPEGDFTPDEVKLALEHGCVPVSLGSSVLKVETAAITAVALARFLLCD